MLGSQEQLLFVIFLILDIFCNNNHNLTEAEYKEVIRRKTAMLFEAACRVSAVIADATEAQETALSKYGYNLGIAFQMADDLFDYTLQTSDFGKEVGADLREGKLTLPVIRTFRRQILEL